MINNKVQQRQRLEKGDLMTGFFTSNTINYIGGEAERLGVNLGDDGGFFVFYIVEGNTSGFVKHVTL